MLPCSDYFTSLWRDAQQRYQAGERGEKTKAADNVILDERTRARNGKEEVGSQSQRSENEERDNVWSKKNIEVGKEK